MSSQLVRNKAILDHIQKFGIDQLINNIDPEDVEEHVIKVILRTIQHSKETLVNTSEELTKEEIKREISPPIAS